MTNNFAAWLNTETETRGWSFRELGRRSGLSAASISDVINEKIRPGFKFCVKIARAFRMPPEDVLRRAGLLPSLPAPVEEEQEILGILRILPDGTRQMVRSMLRGLSRDGGGETEPVSVPASVAVAEEQPNYEPGPIYGPETTQMLRELAEGLTKVSPETRERLTREYLSLLEFAEAAEAAGQREAEEEREREEKEKRG